MRLLLVLLLALVLAAPTTAAIVPGDRGTVAKLATDYADPDVWVGERGDAAVLVNQGFAIHLALRPASGPWRVVGTLGRPDNGQIGRLIADRERVHGVLYSVQSWGGLPPYFAPLNRDGTFGTPERMPGFVSGAAVLPDGRLLVLIEDASGLRSATRTPSGDYAIAPIGGPTLNGSSLVVQPDGQATALWTTAQGFRSADRRPDGSWSEPVPLPGPAMGPGTQSYGASFAADGSGGLGGAWSVAPEPDRPAIGPPEGTIHTAWRPAGGEWRPGGLTAPGIAPRLDTSPGGAVLTFIDRGAVRAALAAPGGPFAAPFVVGPDAAIDAAIDGAGRAALLRGATLYSADATCFAPVQALTGDEPDRRASDLALRGDGTGVAVWVEGSGGEVAVRSVDLRPRGTGCDLPRARAALVGARQAGDAVKITVRLRRPGRVYAVLGRRGKTLAAERWERRAGEHTLRIRLPYGRRPLSLSVAVQEGGGGVAAFRRIVRLKA